ncbi:MAG: transcriptional regulator [Candidatus Diapherotrites archaeon CG11_big_fil_rev_8_21_14_0_20_37_9]|nr:MAG: transcriptional regulator [Candidatus Diapherotrites archaeon CG11_big_fil_rev_8_21_14_0_20_37_9]
MDTENSRMGLGSIESKILSDLASEGKNIFTVEDVAKIVGSKEKANNLVSKLAKKKWLERLSKGTYLILELAAGSKPEWSEDSFYIASKIAKKYYIGYLSMLNYYGWTEQIPTTVTITTANRLKDKKIMGTKYEFISISTKKFFGFKEANIRGHKIIVSNKEKTIVDCLDHPEYSGGIDEVAKAMANAKIDWGKAIEYAEKMDNGAIFKRMGFLLEEMEITVPKELVEKIRKKITKGYSPLYPGINTKGKYNTKWNLIINTKFSKKIVLT